MRPYEIRRFKVCLRIEAGTFKATSTAWRPRLISLHSLNQSTRDGGLPISANRASAMIVTRHQFGHLDHNPELKNNK
jgi:hypothetical protein